ncbi:hypothetical protein MPSD_37080 [Mycobacterium pseudoshottsii JCM 15466]|uniref:Uncharacterized protein n=1 Tax=Mycobacterium pseudoshottsii TaxID=265949 RepID=A0A9N7LWZ3_9MYCO|nr:hypothetical protein MMSP_2564 [Mycobacterium sp. 012931]MBC9865146.1 hypothetical protein [Mycobacterium pseudoshottsii]BBA89109.1 hypothetical protein MPSD_37080 [Mycobacterium pseudoshottsii JCM 15466]BDN83429.1 hypothetical protein NJB1907Z4_C36440 [Mycobacterium pseudoshottsii]
MNGLAAAALGLEASGWGGVFGSQPGTGISRLSAITDRAAPVEASAVQCYWSPADIRLVAATEQPNTARADTEITFA